MDIGDRHPDARRRTDSRRQQVLRRRTVAGAAVVVCLVADVWSVAAAGAREVHPERTAAASAPFVPSTRNTPTVEQSPAAGSTAAASADPNAETVPDAAPATPAPAGGRAAAPAVVQHGTGSTTAVTVPAAALGTPPVKGRTVRWSLEIEDGLGIDPGSVATTVATVLKDPRGWQTKDGVRFVNVTPAQAKAGAPVDLRITLASPDYTDRLCAPLQTRGQVSCHNGGRVVLNARRWLLGADAYGKDLAGYRTYLVNHEVGHGIGHAHEYCGGPGTVAPVMMQQTYGLKGCTAWPWPTTKPA
ncbi:MAG: hypothetical protein JWP82_2287 [Humibacillus sp.]|nr:hypothetical protein [Humibacillus sp.]